MLSLVWHLIYMSVFVTALGFALHYYAFKRGLGDEHDVVSTKYLKKTYKDQQQDYKTGNGFLDKWLAFGGGYYGIIAFIQLIFIELNQVQEFIADWQGFSAFIQSLGMGTLINILIEQIMNFVAAICWPVDYLSRFSIAEIGVFVAITYFAYSYSRRLARARLDTALLS